ERPGQRCSAPLLCVLLQKLELMKSLFSVVVAVSACCVAASTRYVSVEHAFGPNAEFTQRGSLEISIDPSRAVGPSATLQPVKLPDASQMEDLIANDGLYLIRVATDESSGRHVVAAVPACQLRLSSFREEITLHVEWDGLIVGLDYKSPVGPLASTRDCTKMQVSGSSEVTSKITVVRSASAQSVPLQVLANSPPPGLQNLKEQIGTKDSTMAGNQSLLVKYWYIFLPCLLFYMFNTGGPEQGTQAAPAASGGR
ncbi:unnamed protein product, partial [Pylaiella littoralis]